MGNGSRGFPAAVLFFSKHSLEEIGSRHGRNRGEIAGVVHEGVHRNPEISFVVDMFQKCLNKEPEAALLPSQSCAAGIRKQLKHLPGQMEYPPLPPAGTLSGDQQVNPVCSLRSWWSSFSPGGLGLSHPLPSSQGLCSQDLTGWPSCWVEAGWLHRDGSVVTLSSRAGTGTPRGGYV